MPIESLSPDVWRRVVDAVARVRTAVNIVADRDPQPGEDAAGVVFELRAALAECLAAIAANDLHLHRLAQAAKKKAGNGGT